MKTNRRTLIAIGLSAMACSSKTVPVGAYGETAGAGGEPGELSAESTENSTGGSSSSEESAAHSVAGSLQDAEDSPGPASGVLVGPEGAILEAEGVRVIIPADALDYDAEVSLIVDPDTQTLTVSPDLVLHGPARVELPWVSVPGDAVLFFAGDSGWHEVATIAQDDTGSFYESDQLSQHQLRRREVVADCWEAGWNHRLARSGEECAGSLVTEPTVCASAFPTLLEEASSAPLSEPEITRVRVPGTTTPYSSERMLDVREFEGVSVVWKADPVPTEFGTCATDQDCAGNQFRASGECVNGTCSFARQPFESYVLRYDAAATLLRAQQTLQAELPEYTALIKAALDTSGRFHSPASLHYAGRAVDVSLWNLGENREATSAELEENLPKLAPILLRAGFAWVWFESEQHLHASIDTSCRAPLERCSCDAPTVASDSSNLTCDPTSGSNDCPSCFPQHFACDSGVPPVEGCISNGLNTYCCPELNADFPCVPTAATRVGTTITESGEFPRCETELLEDGTPARYPYSCASQNVPDCYQTSGGATIYCDEEWYITSSFCCSRPY